MARITEKARKVAELAWTNGNITILWVDTNENTGAVRLYQRVRYPTGRYGTTSRHTGKSIKKVIEEIRDAEGKGEFRYTYHDAAAASTLI